MSAPCETALERLGWELTQDVLVVSLGEKKLHHVRFPHGWLKPERKAQYVCSSGRNPPSCGAGSYGTPLGLHRVEEKYGDDAPPGTVFVGRESTGECYWERADFGPDQPMFVTTRILRLRGLDPDLNAGEGRDSFDRYIYIHGTTRPECFPANLSGGCITLLDEDLIELYAAVPIGTLVWIQLA